MRAIVISHIYTEKSGTSCFLFSTFAQIYHTIPVSMQYITCVLLTFYIYIHMLHSHQFQFNSNTIVSDTEFCFSAMSQIDGHHPDLLYCYLHLIAKSSNVSPKFEKITPFASEVLFIESQQTLNTFHIIAILVF